MYKSGGEVVNRNYKLYEKPGSQCFYNNEAPQTGVFKYD